MPGDKEAASDAAATARPAADTAEVPEDMPTRHVLALPSAARGLLRPGRRVPAAIIGHCISRQSDTITLLLLLLSWNGHKRRWHFVMVLEILRILGQVVEATSIVSVMYE